MALSEAAISALISGAASIAGAGISAGSVALANRRQWKYWQKQHNILRHDWDIQNFYNSPQQQMLRYKEAGLNPNLIYGQQNTASELNPAPPPNFRSPLEPIAQAIPEAVNGAMSRLMQIRQLRINEANSDALVKLYAAREQQTREDAALKHATTALKTLQHHAYASGGYYDNEVNLQQHRMKLYAEQINNLIARTAVEDLHANFLEKTLQNRIQQVYADLNFTRLRSNMQRLRNNSYNSTAEYQYKAYLNELHKEQHLGLIDRNNAFWDMYDLNKQNLDLRNLNLLRGASLKDVQWNYMNNKYDLLNYDAALRGLDTFSKSLERYMNFYFKGAGKYGKTVPRY